MQVWAPGVDGEFVQVKFMQLDHHEDGEYVCDEDVKNITAWSSNVEGCLMGQHSGFKFWTRRCRLTWFQ